MYRSFGMKLLRAGLLRRELLDLFKPLPLARDSNSVQFCIKDLLKFSEHGVIK